MARSSSSVGMTMAVRLDVFDIVFHLASVGSAQADDPAHFATFYKGHATFNIPSHLA
jgi:hypothetical protein